MRAFYLISALAVTILSQPVFADADNNPCTPVANACVSAGFDKMDGGKQFWQGCMRPVLLGQSVSGVTVSADDVKTCRAHKVKELRNDLKDMQAAMRK